MAKKRSARVSVESVLPRAAMLRMALIAATGVCAASPATATEPSGATDESAPFEVLHQQARYWVNRGRGDLAASSLRRILASDPDNARALYEIALLLIGEGDITSARTFEARLRRQEDAHDLATQLRREIDNAEVDRNLLNEARRRAIAGEIEVALGLYEKLFAGREIGGGLAIEYYETLAGMEERWNEAAQGLRQHYDRQPSNGRVRLAMAKVFSYREETRREALFHLSMLLDDSVFREEAMASMREALLWLNASPEDQKHYERYLSLAKDEAVAEKLALALNPKVIDAFTAARIEAYKALNEGQLGIAEQRFTDLLSQRSNDAETLGGLGLLKLRRGQFNAAADYLTRAIRADASMQRNFGQALADARFWGGHAEIVRLIERSEYEKARQLASRLEALDEKQRIQLHLLSARIASKTSDWPEAERVSRLALAIEPNHAEAAAILLETLTVQRKYEELERVLSRFERAFVQGSVRAERTQAAMRRARAQIAAWREDWTGAAAAYEQAVRADADDHWLRLEYARLLIKLDRRREAEALMATLSRAAADGDAAHALALYYADTDNWERCLTAVEQIPSSARKRDVQELAEVAQIKHRIELAQQRASMGDRATAVSEMLALREFRTTSPYKTMLVADGLLKLGLGDQAGLLVKRALESESPRSLDIVVQYARILAEAGELNSAYRLMTDIVLRRGELSGEQRKMVARVYDDILLRASRRALSDRQYDLALRYLDPVYRANPLNGTVLRYLGEVHQRRGQFASARKFYEAAMSVDTSDLWAVQGAVGAALDEDDIESATRILEDALTRFPDNPEIYTLISRTAHSANDLDMAIEAAERAKRLRGSSELPAMQPVDEYPAPPGDRLPPISPENPFRVSAPDATERAVASTARPVRGPKPAWHEGWSLVKVAAVDQPESETDGAASSWTALESASSLEAVIAAEIEATRREMAVKGAAGDSQATLVVNGFPAGVELDTVTALLELLSQKGNHQQVEQVALGVLGTNDLAAADAERLTELLYPSALHLAEVALERRDFDAVIGHLRAILNVPRAEQDVRFMTLMARYSRGIEELDKAAALYDRALKLAPADEQLRAEVIAARLEANDVQAASAIAREGLERNPDSPRLHYLVGRMAKDLGDLESAMHHLLMAREAQSKSSAGTSTPATSPLDTLRSALSAAPTSNVSASTSSPSGSLATHSRTPASRNVTETRVVDEARWDYLPVDTNDYRGRTFSVAAALPDESRSEVAQPRPGAIDIRERLRNLGREGSAGRDRSGAPRESALGNALDSELEVLRAEASPFFGLGLGFRYRSGEQGLSRLTEFRAPMDFDFNPFLGRLKLLVEPIYLSAGEFGDDPNRARRFGTLALVDEDARFAPVDDNVGGVGVVFGYTNGGLTIDVGTTPLGFETLNMVGGFELEHRFGSGFNIGVDVSRRAVTESILSYAGSIDPLTGTEWGAVTNNEVTLGIGQSFEGFSIYGDAWYGINVGENVEDNEHYGADFGFTVELLSRPGRSFRAGFNTTYFTYDKNLRFFTLGHGGYFSPQSFYSSSVPIEYELSSDRLQLRFSGAVGVQYFSEDSAFYFPDRTDLQTELFEFEFEQPVIYDGQSQTDFAFRASTELVYKVSPQLQIRSSLGVERTADWTESIGLVTVQYRPGL